MTSSYVDPATNPDGYLEWLDEMGILPPRDGSPWRMIGSGDDGSKYMPDQIMRTYFLSGIEEDSRKQQTYNITWEDYEYGNCGEKAKWSDQKPKWGKQGGEVACEVIETPIKTAGDSATEFVLKTCRFPAKEFQDKFYAQQDGHLTPTDLRNMCVMGKSFASELTGNTRSLAYANSSFDSVPNSNLQSPLLMFYGGKTMDRDKVKYPIYEVDLRTDTTASGYGPECSAEITRRDNTARVNVETMRNAVENPNNDENMKKNAFEAAFTSIKAANQRVAQKCFPLYNKNSGQEKSLTLDTIAGNIFQIATLPAGDYEEFKEWRGLSDDNKDAFRTQGLMAFSDSSCRNARSIGYHLCMNLPRAVVIEPIINTIYDRCGFDRQSSTTTDIREKLKELKKGWEEDVKGLVNGLNPTDRYVIPCDEAKRNFANIIDNISARITTNPALGSEGVSCAALKTDMACGTFMERFDLPDVPQFEEGRDTKLRSWAYAALLGEMGINCALGVKDSDMQFVFTDVCGINRSSAMGKDIDKMLTERGVQEEMARRYAFSLDPSTFSEDCKKLRTPEFRMKCHIMSKVVPEVCATAATAEKVCTAFGDR
jgi:hypothetical protein